MAAIGVPNSAVWSARQSSPPQPLLACSEVETSGAHATAPKQTTGATVVMKWWPLVKKGNLRC